MENENLISENELKEIIKDEIKKNGKEIDINIKTEKNPSNYILELCIRLIKVIIIIFIIKGIDIKTIF